MTITTKDRTFTPTASTNQSKYIRQNIDWWKREVWFNSYLIYQSETTDHNKICIPESFNTNVSH